jgi:hypothetical protein
MQYLEALCEDNVEFVPQELEVVENGVKAKDGTFYEVDIIITATGYVGYEQLLMAHILLRERADTIL